MLATLERLGIDALIPIGGEDTLGVATRLAEAGVAVVGVPKTIDNDLDATDYTFGFDTAVGVAMEAIDRLHTTGDSHHRTLVVEVMGRHAGWIALHAGMAGGANVVLIPEKPFDVDAVVAHCRHRFESGFSPIVVVSEGAAPLDGGLMLAAGERDAFGHVRLGGIGAALAAVIEERTNREARAVVLGHVQRGGTPSPFDRVLATRFGLAAVDAVHAGESGVMVALRGTDIVRVRLERGDREAQARARRSATPRPRSSSGEASLPGAGRPRRTLGYVTLTDPAELVPGLDRWRELPAAQQPTWPDRAALDAVLGTLSTVPPIVAPSEVDALRAQLADVARARRSCSRAATARRPSTSTPSRTCRPPPGRCCRWPSSSPTGPASRW